MSCQADVSNGRPARRRFLLCDVLCVFVEGGRFDALVRRHTRQFLTMMRKRPTVVIKEDYRSTNTPTMTINPSRSLCLHLVAPTMFVATVLSIFAHSVGASTTFSKSFSTIFRLRGGDSSPRKKYRILQVQIAHRHGDRTPITPMKDEEFWAKTLSPPELLEKIGAGTTLVRRDEAMVHSAGGRGPFGKLTQMGLFQMVEVGSKIRDELVTNELNDFSEDENGHLCNRFLWDPSRPIHPKDVKILSTDFPRTIQSVQGVLIGLFPDGVEGNIDIDCRHTSWLIPDPQPRRSNEQEELEMKLATRPHFLEREFEMHPLAVKCTEAVRDLLGDGAFTHAFGVGEDNSSSKPEHERALSWAQLSEITKCLKVRERLPSSITAEEQKAVMDYTAWRWFESLRDPRLIHLSMHKFASTIVHSMRYHQGEPPLTIYSAHDSTLIGLMCAFRLEQPSVWPEYGSYLKIELHEVTDADKIDDDEKEHVVRFFLNGQLLRSMWDGKPREYTPLDLLFHKIKTEGAVNAN
jgi:hypothetical protein